MNVGQENFAYYSLDMKPLEPLCSGIIINEMSPKETSITGVRAPTFSQAAMTLSGLRKIDHSFPKKSTKI